MTAQEAFWDSWFGLSVTGLAVVTLLLAATMIHRWTRGRHNRLHRWLLAVTAGVAIASFLTPADLASTLVLSAAFLAFYAFGATSRSAPVRTDG